jgi:excisionase family DNA binding protein
MANRGRPAGCREKRAAVQRQAYRVREVAEALGMGESTIWDGVYAGTIPSRKVGQVRLIPALWVETGSFPADPEADSAAPSQGRAA